MRGLVTRFLVEHSIVMYFSVADRRTQMEGRFAGAKNFHFAYKRMFTESWNDAPSGSSTSSTLQLPTVSPLFLRKRCEYLLKFLCRLAKAFLES